MASQLAPTALAIGDQAPELVVGPITRTQVVRFAGAGGDFNPMHHDEIVATDAGFPSVFAHGQLTAGLLSRQVAGWLGFPNVRSYDVRFTGQVWPGDVLTCHGEVEDIQDEGARRIARCAFTVTRQTGDIVVRATATAEVA